MEKSRKLELSLKAVIAFLISFIFSFLLVIFLVSKAETTDKKLIKLAYQINQECPLMLNSETRLDSIIARTGKSFFTIILY